jgi:hypothetical protein
MSLAELRASHGPDLAMRAMALTGEKRRIAFDRARSLIASFPDDSLEAALRRTVAPEFLTGIG